MSSTWAGNSHENRLTPWSNDPVSDPPAEVSTSATTRRGDVCTPPPCPSATARPYTISHGHGYTVYEHTSHEHRADLRVFVPPEDPLKICRLTSA